jgi:predicted O-methyltransferase YrrM
MKRENVVLRYKKLLPSSHGSYIRRGHLSCTQSYYASGNGKLTAGSVGQTCVQLTDMFTAIDVPLHVMKPEDVLETIEREAPRKGWPIIGPKRGVILDEVVNKYRPTRILEVGTLVGYSAIRMGRHLKEGCGITCVEVSPDMARTARSNFEKAGLSDRIEVRVGDALEILPTLTDRLDMVFLDAVKQDYKEYLLSVEQLLHKGSVVAADNVKSHAAEVAEYLDYVRNSGRYTSTYRESPDNYRYGKGTLESDAVEVSVKL